MEFIAAYWGLLLIGAVVLLVLFWVIGTYNSLVRLRENVSNSMGQIAAQIESRWDAVTNLIAAAQQYASYEAQTLTQVINQRRPVTAGSSVADVEADEQTFAGALARFNALAEQYPQLKASETYANAMNAVNQYENNVRHSRMFYNDSVTKLNRSIRMFPTLLIARPMGFTLHEYFTNTATKAQMPTW